MSVSNETLKSIQMFGCTWLRFYCRKHNIPIVRFEGDKRTIQSLCKRVFDSDYEGLFFISGKTIKNSNELVEDFLANYLNRYKVLSYGAHYYFKVKKPSSKRGKENIIVTDPYTLKVQSTGSAQFCFLYALYFYLAYKTGDKVELKTNDFVFNTQFIMEWFREQYDALKSNELRVIRDEMNLPEHRYIPSKNWRQIVESAIETVIEDPADYVSDEII
jgi:hypothetical protein